MSAGRGAGGVRGKRARIVPVLARFHEPLLAAAAFAGEPCSAGEIPAQEPDRALVAPFCDRGPCRGLKPGGCDPPGSEAARLIGLQAFMAAAGVRCSQRLGDIAAWLPALSEAEMLALLGGSP